jgi:hypothetical protein
MTRNAYHEGGRRISVVHRISLYRVQRVLKGERRAPCRAIDLRCGTGPNSIWLLHQAFDVVGGCGGYNADATALCFTHATGETLVCSAGLG